MKNAKMKNAMVFPLVFEKRKNENAMVFPLVLWRQRNFKYEKKHSNVYDSRRKTMRFL